MTGCLRSSGYPPEYLAHLHALYGNGNMVELRRLGHYTRRALAASELHDYSQVIREGVPGVEHGSVDIIEP
ncbi:MAG TPA: hypothetical protein VF285_03430 [Castellaniella sp.]|uniref:hypothetical protein n=1 Tax=Castellaniella sp. TaxID=1955812 RepID=UPI002F134CA4